MQDQLRNDGVSGRRGGRKSKRRWSLVLAIALVASMLASAPLSADPGDLQTDCSTAPATMAPSDLEPGMSGTGYTAIAGTQPVEFDVEILGVLPDGIGLGLDMIVARASGPVMDEVGGVARGMSGSPIYIGGQLIGALAYGFSGTDTVFGITPADAMLTVLDYPSTPPPAPMEPMEGTDASSLSIQGAAHRLPLPFGISGINPERVDLLSGRLLESASVVPLGNNSDGGEVDLDATSLPGEPVSAVLSYGDISAFGTGTTTACRGDEVIAFGHPANFTGLSSMGMSTANIITVIDDESELFGNYKMATFGSLFGRIDRDHLAGIRGINGEIPVGIPITSMVTYEELGNSRMGQTKALDQDFLPDIAFSHTFANIDAVFDAVGEGSSSMSFSIEGMREGGAPFSVERSNMHSSQFDISYETAYELPDYLATLIYNSFEDVEITSVSVDELMLFSEANELVISEVVITSNQGETTEGFISAVPGEELLIDVTLVGDGSEFTESLSITLPSDIVSAYGNLSISGSADGFFGPVEEPGIPGQGGGGPGSLDDLLDGLNDRPTNSDLVARLELFEEAGMFVPEPIVVEERVTLDSVVRGNQYFDVSVFDEGTLPPAYEVVLEGTGFGGAYLEVGPDGIYFDVFAETESPTTAIHIHRGYEGEDGPVVVDLDFPNLGYFGWIEADPVILDEINADPFGFYLNVHTEAMPDGALRGQLTPMNPPIEPPVEPPIEPPYPEPANAGGYVSPAGEWYLPGEQPFWFGVPGDVPFLGDWDGDGIKTPGLYRPSSGYAYVRNSNDTGMADVEWFMGVPGDIPLVGDWDGDGIDSFGVFRPSEAVVYLRNSHTTGFADIEFMYGMGGDIPFAGDFDGSGIDDIGVHRDGRAYIRLQLSEGMADLEYEIVADDIIVGDWDGDGIDDLGAVRDGLLYSVDASAPEVLGVAEGLIRRS